MKPIYDIYSFLTQNIGFSKGLWILIGAIAFALLCLLFIGLVRSGKVKAGQTFIEAGLVAIWHSGVFALSLLTFWPKGEPLWRPSNPVLVWLVVAAVLLVVLTWIYLHRKKRFADRVSATAIRRSAAGSGAGKYARALLLGGSLVLAVLAGVSCLVSKGVGFSWLIPLVIVVVFEWLAVLTRWRIWHFLGALCVLAFVVLSMQQLLSMNGFSVTPLLAGIPVYLSVILPMFTLTFLKLK